MAGGRKPAAAGGVSAGRFVCRLVCAVFVGLCVYEVCIRPRLLETGLLREYHDLALSPDSGGARADLPEAAHDRRSEADPLPSGRTLPAAAPAPVPRAAQPPGGGPRPAVRAAAPVQKPLAALQPSPQSGPKKVKNVWPKGVVFPVWTWWEFPGGAVPGTALACLESWRARVPAGTHELRLVNRSNIRNWLPDIAAEFFLLPVADGTAASEVARAGLLAQHGGLFVDTDVLLQGRMTELARLMQDYDLVAFTQGAQRCARGELSTSLLASMRANPIAVAWYEAAASVLKRQCKAAAACDVKAATLRVMLSVAFKTAGEPPIYCFDELSTGKPESKIWGLTPGCDGCFLTPVGDIAEVYRQVPKAMERFAYVLSESPGFWRRGEGWGGLRSLDLDSLCRGDSLRSELFRRLARGEAAQVPRMSACPGQKPVFPPLPRDGERKLALIHIPRTGGTTIEDCSQNEADDDDRWSARNARFHFQVPLPNGAGKCWGQHIPPTMEPMQTLFAPFADDTFCVVRDPFARLVSEYGFYQSWTKPENRKCGADWMNIRMVEWLSKYLGLNGSKPGPYSRDCHMLPQAAYVYGWDPVKSEVLRDVKSCKNIIRFEKLHADFNSLMEKRGYPYRLTAKKSMPSLQCTTTLRREDFSPRAKELVYQIYRDDFELLGYPMEAPS